MGNFNVRVYGLLINEYQEVLLSDEEEYGKRFIKFPGGGLEYGEGLIAGLKREFLEECDLAVEIIRHFYTTDFFVESVFGGGQLIAVYYIVKAKADLKIKISHKVYDFEGQEGKSKQSFRWVPIQQLQKDTVTFPVDQYVVELLKVEKL
ncbi:MAG: NUDIX domain-containing protein [Sphingobacteriales bacterium]|nr:NUDIX domain-containing protein [Sphingobacteriales bacterium]